MVLDRNKRLCRCYRLTYVDPETLELQRRRCGRGFAYLDAAGRTVKDREVKARIKRLAIPPAWAEVRIARDPRAHIQAIGTDADGRRQYRYHADWENVRAESKEERLLRFGEALPLVRGAVDSALAAPRLTRTKLVAAVVRLIDRAWLRPGYDEYARSDGGRGAATLLKKDVSVEADTVILEFHAKSGKKTRRVVEDGLLARLVKKLVRWRGRRLFALPDKAEPPVSAREVNAFLVEASGGLPVSAKDFRTFAASAGALAALAGPNSNGGETLKRKALIEAADKASEGLANTRAVARTSYIHPAVIRAYEAGKLEAGLLKGGLRKGLSRVESAFLRFLEKRSKRTSAATKP
jgi:DNA topoisomerase-1